MKGRYSHEPHSEPNADERARLLRKNGVNSPARLGDVAGADYWRGVIAESDRRRGRGGYY